MKKSSQPALSGKPPKGVCWWMPEMGPHARRLVSQAVDANYPNEGKLSEEFERKIAGLTGSAHGVSASSGTAGLFLALKALGIGRGDEVLVPDLTFIATANAVELTGATPVLVDVDPATLCICPEAARKAVHGRTRAIVPVHVSGRGADMKSIMSLAREKGLFVVEDAAEALLSKKDDRFLGTYGECGVFSFSPNKAITTGQGGVVVTESASLAKKIHELKDQGRATRGTGGDDRHPVVGYNFKFTNIQAALGLAQLPLLEKRLARMRKIREQYGEGLPGTAGISLFPFDLETGEQPLWTDAKADHRSALTQHLSAKGMGTRNFWHPLHTQKPYRRDNRFFPAASSLIGKLLWLPSAFSLSRGQIAAVVKAIRDFHG